MKIMKTLTMHPSVEFEFEEFPIAKFKHSELNIAVLLLHVYQLAQRVFE